MSFLRLTRAIPRYPRSIRIKATLSDPRARESNSRIFFLPVSRYPRARYPWKKANEAIILLFLPFSPLYRFRGILPELGFALYISIDLSFVSSIIFIYGRLIKFANNINDSSLNIVLIRIGGRF